MTLRRPDAPNDIDPDNPDGFDVRDTISFVCRQWKLIAGVSVLGLLIGVVIVSRQTPLYTATAQLFLYSNKQKPTPQDLIVSDFMRLNRATIESQMAIIKSSTLLRRVVEQERLTSDPEFGSAPSPKAPGLVSAIKAFFVRDPAPTADLRAAQPDAKGCPPVAMPDEPSAAVVSAIERLKSAVNVSRADHAYVIDISVTSANAAKAARLANAVANAYVVDKLDAYFEGAQRISSWLSDRLEGLRKNLRESEEAAAQFRAKNNLSQAPKGSTLNQEQLDQWNGRLVAARAETAEKKARLDMLQRIEASGGNINSLPGMMVTDPIADLRKQAAEISRQEADLLARYSRNHPSVVNVHAQLADIQRLINAELHRVSDSIRKDYELAKSRQEAVESEMRDATGQADIDSANSITLRELERNVSVNKRLVEDFLRRSRLIQEQSTFETRDARVIIPALAPGEPSPSKKIQSIVTWLITALIAGSGVAYLLEVLNAGFETPRQVETLLELPVLAAISRMDAHALSVDGATLSIPEYAAAKPLSRLSEELRTLRNAVRMTDVDRPPKVLQVTSSVPGEGKTTITLALAASAAFSGLKTLVIDADFRHASTSRHFRLEKSKGLVEYLIGESELPSVIYFNEKANVWVLPSGGETQNAADLLGSEKFEALIGLLREHFDLVMIDSPPVGPVVDSVIISTLVDKVIFVVRWASTARELVSHSIQRLSGRPKVAGVVFSQVVDSKAQKYGKNAFLHYSGGQYQNYYRE